MTSHCKDKISQPPSMGKCGHTTKFMGSLKHFVMTQGPFTFPTYFLGYRWHKRIPSSHPRHTLSNVRMMNQKDLVFLSIGSSNFSFLLPTSTLLHLYEREISFFFVKTYFGLHYFLHPSLTLNQFLSLQYVKVTLSLYLCFETNLRH